MDALIRKAFVATLKLEFFYKDKHRVIEPHTYGQILSGKAAICGWQLIGGSGVNFRIFLLEDIHELKLGEVFSGHRPEYKRGDRRFGNIYAEL